MEGRQVTPRPLSRREKPPPVEGLPLPLGDVLSPLPWFLVPSRTTVVLGITLSPLPPTRSRVEGKVVPQPVHRRKGQPLPTGGLSLPRRDIFPLTHSSGGKEDRSRPSPPLPEKGGKVDFSPYIRSNLWTSQ